ncbi:MAG: uroporphyrinogen-III C-methyltransferase [Devosia sp. 67-54]|uniref:siroheme synthase CysG n=1 Tax=unclassified Devosia TaxID=196773 RepID=UPI0009680C83|nr:MULTISPECIES: siroheme synthase CysG [unclassified Devosia]MBN9303967.1 uroporphyrinogen-III C-methyltransferase [Devosia sp.]OJX17811.1 MAG: uroporphyrinogen-III C-methyltransferase [Devosia sp. 67-54]
MGELNTFPVSYKVKGQRIVVVGGGEEALNKARLAAKTTASVVIISDEATVSFDGIDHELVSGHRGFGALEGAALVFVAEKSPVADAVKAEARRRGIPVNVVDTPDECDFYVPSIVERAPLTVAVSTEGDAPVLARLVRAQIEAMLSPDTGRLARLAGSLRGRVAATLGKLQARRFYEDLVTGVGEPEALLDAHAGEAAGEVWLIGAGPGAEDLLTLRAQRLLQAADVIVHDQLVPDAVIEMGRRDAERISVGKKKGHHSFTQAQINALLVRLARQGKRVARLKSGDPMVFGRAGEEIAALRKAGIGYRIVPGVSAALAAAADTATPVTLRRVSPGVIFATAHGADSAELDHWAALAGAGLTLALYMGKSIAMETAGKLLRRGMRPDLPVGVVANAGRRNRSLYRATLGDIAADGADMADGPAVIFIGEAVAHGDWAAAEDLAVAKFKVA